MPAVLLLAAILAMGAVFLVPLLGLAAVLVVVAVLALAGAGFRSLFEGIAEMLSNPIVICILAVPVIWIAIAVIKVPVGLVVLGAIVLLAAALLEPFFRHIEDTLSGIFDHPFMKALVLMGIAMTILIVWARHK